MASTNVRGAYTTKRKTFEVELKNDRVVEVWCNDLPADIRLA